MSTTKSVSKKFRTEKEPLKYKSIKITDDLSILDLKKIVLKSFFLRANQKYISDIALTNLTTNYFDSAYNNDNAYNIFSKEDNKWLIYKDSRYTVHIDIYGPKSNSEIVYPISLLSGYESLIKFLSEETKTDTKYISIYRNNGNRDLIEKTDNIAKFKDEGIIAFLFPISAEFTYKKLSKKMNFKFNDFLQNIKQEIGAEFKLKPNDFLFELNGAILTENKMIYDILKTADQKPKINVILNSKIKVHVPFINDYFEFNISMALKNELYFLVSKIQDYFNINTKIELLMGNKADVIDLNKKCHEIINDDFKYVTVKSEKPLKVIRYIKVRNLYMKIEINPQDHISDIIQHIANEIKCDPYNISLIAHTQDGKEIKMMKSDKFTDYFILPNDEIIANIIEHEVDSKDEKEHLETIARLRAELQQKDDIISRNQEEINTLKEKNQQLSKLKFLKKTKKEITYFQSNEYQKEQSSSSLLGTGGFSNVYKVSKNQKYAMKELNENGSQNNGMKRFISESEILFRLRHPCIVRIYGFNKGDDENPPSIILNLEPQSLEKVIEDGSLSEKKEKARIVVEIVLGMRYIHSKNVIHRDLKPNNILLSRNNHVRISDFGLALFDDPEVKKTNSAGSLLFMAPELLSIDDDDESEKIEYNNKIDVFAFSIVLYYIIVGGYPTLNWNRVIAGLPLKVPPTVPKWVEKMINACQSLDPNDRPTFNDIFEIIKSHNFNLFSDDEHPSYDVSEILDRISKIEAFEFMNNEPT